MVVMIAREVEPLLNTLLPASRINAENRQVRKLGGRDSSCLFL